MPLLSPSEGPTLCFLLSVSAREVFPPLALPATSCATGQPVATPAGCAVHMGCVMGSYPTWSPKHCQWPLGTPLHLWVHLQPLLLTQRHITLIGTKSWGVSSKAIHPCKPFCTHHPTFPSCPC